MRPAVELEKLQNPVNSLGPAQAPKRNRTPAKAKLSETYESKTPQP